MLQVIAMAAILLSYSEEDYLGEMPLVLQEIVGCHQEPSERSAFVRYDSYCVDAKASLTLPGLHKVYEDQNQAQKPVFIVVISEASRQRVHDWTSLRVGRKMLLVLEGVAPLPLWVFEPIDGAISVSGDSQLADVIESIRKQSQ